jgi:hypothetical protein
VPLGSSVNINNRFNTTENNMAPCEFRRMDLAILTEEKAGEWGRNSPQFAALFPDYTGGLQEKYFSLKEKCVFVPLGVSRVEKMFYRCGQRTDAGMR